MANAFEPTPVGGKRKVVQMDPSLLQQASIATEFQTMDKVLDMSFDMSSSVATTAATSSASSFHFPEDFQYSLRKVLNVAETPFSPSAEDLLHKFPKVVGHRGCLYEELENTREGFSRCHNVGCDAVELDVFKVRRNNKDKDDTTLVVFHGGGTDENPGDLLDYCGIDGSILDFNYENEISEKLSFNPDCAEFPCPVEKIRNGEIPTLEDVLVDAKRKNNSMLKGYKHMEIKIELKGPDVVEDVLELVDSLGVASMCSYSSFDLQKLKKVRELRPDRDPKTGEYLYKTGALFNNIDANGKILDDDYSPINSVPNWNDCDIIDRAIAVGASEIHLKYDTCNKPLIDRIHSRGLGSMAWFRGPIGMNEDCSIRYRDVGNEDFAMYEALLHTGVQQLCVNKPDVLIALREKLFLEQQIKRKQQLEMLVANRRLGKIGTTPALNA